MMTISTIRTAGAGVTTVFGWVMDIISHFVAGVRDKGLALGVFAFGEKIGGQSGGESSGKGSKGNGLRSLHNGCFHS